MRRLGTRLSCFRSLKVLLEVVFLSAKHRGIIWCNFLPWFYGRFILGWNLIGAYWYERGWIGRLHNLYTLSKIIWKGCWNLLMGERIDIVTWSGFQLSPTSSNILFIIQQNWLFSFRAKLLLLTVFSRTVKYKYNAFTHLHNYCKWKLYAKQFNFEKILSNRNWFILLLFSLQNWVLPFSMHSV